MSETKTTRARVMRCPAASRWLKEALVLSEGRDPVDSANDAEVLLQILKDELEQAAMHELPQEDAQGDTAKGWGFIEATRTVCKVCGLPAPCKHGEYGFRDVRELRKLPVRDLTPEECQRLLVHSHDCTHERRQAYLLKAAGADWTLYFNDATIASRIQASIEAGV